MIERILYFVLLPILFSCGQEKTSIDNIYSIDSRIILGSPISVNLSEIAESISFIKLETHNDALIGNFPRVSYADSLLIVSTVENGVLVFDSETGKYLYKIEGFRDRGPLGYSQVTSPLTIDNRDKLILQKWNSHGMWNYKTGEMLDRSLSISPLKYTMLLFVNDSLLVGCAFFVDLNTPSLLDLLSTSDGSIVREYGLKEKIDEDYNRTNMNRFHLYDFDNYITCYSMLRDTIYGINKTTLNLESRFVLNLGKRIHPNSPVPHYSNYILISYICESSRYLFIGFFNENDDSINFVYYDKKKGKTFYLAKDASNPFARENPGFNNDFTNDMRFFPTHITSDDRAYTIFQATEVLKVVGPERAAEIGITDAEDNPVIMVAQLKR